MIPSKVYLRKTEAGRCSGGLDVCSAATRRGKWKKLQYSCLGFRKIRLGDEKIRFPYKKAEAFFYYLCVRKKVSRDQVICLLWGDEDETSGKKKLRDAVYQVKRLLGKDLLLTGGHTEIELNPQAPLRTDWEKQEEPENEGEF